MADRETQRGLELKSVVRWTIALLIALVAMALLFRALDWQEVRGGLERADYRWASLALAAILATFATRTWRWQALLHHADVGFWPAMTALLVGQVVNLALPLMRSGDLARALWANRHDAVGVSEALGSIALEKVWDLLALSACGIILLIAVPLPGWFAQSTWGTLFVVLVGVALLAVGLHWQKPLLKLAMRLLTHLPERWAAVLAPQLKQLVRALNVLRNPGASANAGLWTAATWALGGLANWAVMRAFGLDSVLGAILLLAALMLGGAVVPTPAGLGVYEGIVVVSLGLFGVSPSQALAVGLVLHLLVIGPPMVTAALLAMASAMTPVSEQV